MPSEACSAAQCQSYLLLQFIALHCPGAMLVVGTVVKLVHPLPKMQYWSWSFYGCSTAESLGRQLGSKAKQQKAVLAQINKIA